MVNNTINYNTCTQEKLIEWLQMSPPCDWQVLLTDKNCVWIKFHTNTTENNTVELEIV